MVSKKCWETVAVYLFGPMPSSKHVVDHEGKLAIQEKTNLSKYRKHSNFVPGDVVLDRDCARKSKFSLAFLSEPFVVTELDDVAKRVILEGLRIQKVIVRHFDDVKEFHGSHDLRVRLIQWVKVSCRMRRWQPMSRASF